jgi:hypothetical protein
MPNVKPANKPSTRPAGGNTVNKPSTADRPNAGNRPNVQPGNKPTTRPSGGGNSGNINNGNIGGGNRGNNNINSGNVNSINVNRNVQVNNYHHNTYYNGYRGYHPYYYHPYHPYVYGPMYHPFGFFITTMAVTATIVAINNQQYYYNAGVYYVPVSGGYNAVPPPVNIVVMEIPDDRVPVKVNDNTYYYYAGIFYIKLGDDQYKVVEAPDGALVSNIPEGGEEVEIEGDKYVFLNNTYFLPVTVNGKDQYQVVEMVPDDTSDAETGNAETDNQAASADSTK